MKYHVKVRSNSKILVFGLLSAIIVQQATLFAQQSSTNNVVQRLMQLEQEKNKLASGQRDLAVQVTNMEKQVAQEQKKLLYLEQQEREWQLQQQNGISEFDSSIKKLEREADFAESERLKIKRNEHQKEFIMQKAQKDEEQKQQEMQVAHYRQESDRLKQEHEKVTADLELKEKQQKDIIDSVVSKSMPLYASNDIVMLRKKAAELKKLRSEIKTSSLKEGNSFKDVLKVPLQAIRERIAYLEKKAVAQLSKQIEQIKKNIIAARRPAELNNSRLAIQELEKNIGSYMLPQPQQDALHDRIEKELNTLIMQKESPEQEAQERQVTVSRSVQEEEQVVIEPEPEVVSEKEPEPESVIQKEQNPVTVAKKVEVKTVQKVESEKKSAASVPKIQKLPVSGFVLNKAGDTFDAIEYKNVAVTTDNDHVTRIVYNNQDISVIAVPESATDTSDSAPEWIAAQIYAQQLGNDQKRIAQALEQSKNYYAQLVDYKPDDKRYNPKLADYLRLGLIPLLEIKIKK